ncbi:MAG: 16S rRNA (adenine(1518)-N(6)/adenine(1519)-N(6))-dimethyltransferase RsmA [Polyangiaceae bacterium]
MSAAKTSPRALLERHGLQPKKSFGQNFLTDAELARRIAELATTPEGGTVLELGAGLGALTLPLLDRASRVIAVERDRDLVPLLATELAPLIEAGRLRVVEADAKSVDVKALFEGTPRPHVLAGNLPYQITGPLLTLAVESARCLDRAVFLLQLEVADRVAAGPGDAAYGALSVFVQAQFRARRAFVIKRGAFHPAPNVDSAVLVLEPLATPAAQETRAFQELVRGAFRQRRKKLRNAWKGVLGKDSETLERAATRCGVDLNARGETLSVAAFACMAEELGS